MTIPSNSSAKVRTFAWKIPFAGAVFICYDPLHVACFVTVTITEQEYLFTLYKLRGIFTPVSVERRTREHHEKCH